MTLSIILMLIMLFWSTQVKYTYCRVFSKHLTIYNHLTKEWNTTNKIISVMPGFGFFDDSNLLFTMQCQNDAVIEHELQPNLWLILCTTSEARSLSQNAHMQLPLECQFLERRGAGRSPLSDNRCRRYRITDNTTARVHAYSQAMRIPEARFYSLLLLQCPNYELVNRTLRRENVYCNSLVTALNPGDTHLSSDEVPLPLLYTVLNMAWALLASLLFLNAVIYCKYSNKLHRLVMALPVLKVLHVLLCLLSWQQTAHTGLESRDLASLVHVVRSVKVALLLVTLLVVAEGWGVVRRGFKYCTLRTLLVLYFNLAVSMLCAYWLHPLFLAVTSCLAVYMLCKALKWTALNVDHLRRCRRKLRSFVQRHNLKPATGSSSTSGAPVELQLVAKLQLVRHFRSLLGCCAVLSACALLGASFLQQHAWAGALVLEAPELLLYAAVGWLLRLRDFSRFLLPELVLPHTQVAVLELPDCCSKECEPEDPGIMLALPIQQQQATDRVERHTARQRRWCRSL